MAKILHALKLKPAKGDIGVEIEIEGVRLPGGTNKWRREADGSLRGEESGEYVLREPVPYANLGTVFEELGTAFEATNARIDPTYRAGVHTHINVQDMTITELFNFIVCFLIMEECIVDFCAPSRRGNHFCLRSKDATYLIERLWRCAEEGELRHLNDEDIRYSAMNLSSLFKYGSIEFRSLESTSDFARIQLWCDILYTLKESSKRFATPVDIMREVSMGGYEYFVKNMFKQHADIIFHTPDWNKKIRRGILQAQDIAYSREWGKISLDIFNKSASDFV